MSLSAKKLALIQARLAAKGLRRESEDSINTRARGEAAQLSFAQERLWFFSQLAEESAVFNIPVAFRINGPLDADCLGRALRSVMQRQESLRSAFGVEGGRAWLKTLEGDFSLPLQLVDAAAGYDQALELARSEAQRPFDIAKAPLLRLTLYTLTAQDHLLLVNMHHIISEVQSVGIFASELASSYAALMQGKEPQLPELPVRFSDFAAWQRARMQGERYDEQLAWWRDKLGGDLPSLQLPTDRQPPAVQTFNGATATRALPTDLVQRLREFCRAKRVTPFSATLALWSALLARYCGQEDILVGVPVTDRNREELRHLIGFFVNTLVMRADLTERPSFELLVARVEDYQRGAQANQEIPFDRLVEELGVARELSHGPIFQAAFLYQTATESGGELPALAEHTSMRLLEDPLAVHTGTSKFAASLVIWDAGSRMSASLEYNADLFDASRIERLLGHFEELLRGALADPAKPLCELPILSADERRLILGEWTQNRMPMSEDCVHTRFEQCAKRTPEALALCCGSEQLTYAQLDERANRMAHHLLCLGLQREDVVAIAAGRSLEMVVGMLATLKAGGAYLPLDLEYPAERLAYQIEHSKARAVLTLASLESSLPLAQIGEMSHAPQCLAMDRLQAQLDAQPGSKPQLADAPRQSQLAYVIYTSGSTGKPKGVALEHRALGNLISWHQRAFHVLPADRASHLAGLAFDAAVWEMWPYLTAGASLHLVPADIRLAPAALLDWLVAQRITQAFWPTPLCEAILQLELPAEMPLEVVFTGGDKLRQAPDKPLPFRLNNNYGPTEGAVVSTSGDVDLQAAADQAPTIGKPIDNVQAYILDAERSPQPIGVPGELFIGGSSLAREYFKSPELTAERFLESPFREGERLYRTGDLVRWREDGEIEFLGRMDEQIKLRGFRIELGEIETILGTHADVSDCALMLQRDERGDGSLAGYVVLAEGVEPDAAGLRGFLGGRLPEYMLPSSFQFLERLPLTPNGKLDRKALPKADLKALAQVDFVAPSSDYEELIAAVWCRLLELERVGVTANFFDVGGHSLLLAQVFAELSQSIDKELAIVDLFRFPTVRSLAEHLAGQSAAPQEELDQSKARGQRRREAAARGRGRRRK